MRALAIAALCAQTGMSGALAEPRAAEPRAAEPRAAGPARTRTAMSQPLAPMDGRRLRTTLVEISYEPGASSASHSHPCPVMVHVVEGAIRSQVQGEPERIYRAGDTFFEAPGGVHQVSANASDRAPARFLAFFVCDRDTPLTVPPSAAGGR
jgi:quercetin dioxygenase-like cupin family protein